MGGGVDSTVSSTYANSRINRTFVTLYDSMIKVSLDFLLHLIF